MFEEIEFGRWESSEHDCAAPLAWRVLERRADGTALLVTRDLIERRSYIDGNHATTWAECDLRAWLNGEFLKRAFSAEERERIVVQSLHTPDNPESGTPGGPDTEDAVFLLARNEVESLFDGDAERVAAPTLYALSQGYCNGWWWLRSPGEFASGPDVVLADGRVYNCSGHYNRSLIAVRPALVARF